MRVDSILVYPIVESSWSQSWPTSCRVRGELLEDFLDESVHLLPGQQADEQSLDSAIPVDKDTGRQAPQTVSIRHFIGFVQQDRVRELELLDKVFRRLDGVLRRGVDAQDYESAILVSTVSPFE